MTIYFINNDGGTFGLPNTTNSTYYRSQFANQAVTFNPNAIHPNIDYAYVPLPQTDHTWIHFTFYRVGSVNHVYDLGPYWEIQTPSGTLCNLTSEYGVYTQNLRYATGSSTTADGISTEFGFTSNALFDVDFHIDFTVGNSDQYQIDLYFDEMLVASSGIVTNSVLGVERPSRFNWGGLSYLRLTRGYGSNLIISDQDTRGLNMKIMDVTGTGFHDGWSGDYTRLTQYDRTTSVTSDEAGQRMSSTITPGADPGLNITSVVLLADGRGTHNPSQPDQITQFIRVGGTDYDGSPTTLSGAVPTTLIHEWTQNPATSAAWTWADLSSLEIGLLSSNSS